MNKLLIQLLLIAGTLVIAWRLLASYGQRAQALRLLEARARSAESDERWDEALAAWQEAAALEASLESAREGIARSTPRAELQRRIEAHFER